MRGAPQFVSPANLHTLLTALEELPGTPEAGFFGPGSVTWQINRESAVFLGAGRAALLQLAHPWVSVALQQHSNLMHDAIGRFHSTFRVIFTMLFGTRAQALAASRQLYAVHTTIQGELPHSLGEYREQEPYQANEIAALRWVFATLVESAVLAYEFVLPPLPEPAKEAFYQQSHRMAALCGMPAAALPPTWAELVMYTAQMMASPELVVDNAARQMGHAVLSGVGTWVRAPRWYRALTASWLPPGLRSDFGLSFGALDQRALARATFWLPLIYSRIPKALRYVGPYHEAQARLRRKRPGALTQRSNRFWMGRPQLLFPDHE